MEGVYQTGSTRPNLAYGKGHSGKDRTSIVNKKYGKRGFLVLLLSLVALGDFSLTTQWYSWIPKLGLRGTSNQGHHRCERSVEGGAWLERLVVSVKIWCWHKVLNVRQYRNTNCITVHKTQFAKTKSFDASGQADHFHWICFCRFVGWCHSGHVGRSVQWWRQLASARST